MPHRLNLKHLHYFWLIARTGSISQASEQLGLTPQTLSSQLASLEETTGTLFHRKGRGLKLTALGEEIKNRADDIFQLVEALDHRIRQPDQQQPLALCVGICASIHKLSAYQLLEPAMQLERPLRLKCLTGHLPDLLKSLQQQSIDILFSDQRPDSEQSRNLYCQPLFSTSLSLFAAEQIANGPKACELSRNFPAALNGQPFLVNDLDAPYFAELHSWLKQQGVRMYTQLEVNDSALIKVFGRQGYGIFAAPSNIADEVCRQYNVRQLGEIDSIHLPHYMITRTPTPLHIAAQAICDFFAAGKLEKS